MSRTISLPAGSLAVMSGVPGSGKSTFLARSHLAAGVVQSADALRRSLVGEAVYYREDGNTEETPVRVQEPLGILDKLIWDVLAQTVRERLKAGLTTVVDATLVADEIPDSIGRAYFAKLAAEANEPFTVLAMGTPLDEAARRNQSRPARVSQAVFERFSAGKFNEKGEKVLPGFEATSRFPLQYVGDDDILRIVAPLRLDSDRVDVVGDVHGMFSHLKQLLGSLGYAESDDGLYRHAQGRKLLFVGDVVDRGPESLAMVEFIRQMVGADLAWCLKGNHEDKLIRFWDSLSEGTLSSWTSYANAETGMALARLPAKGDRAEALVNFLRGLPVLASYESDTHAVLFAHADSQSINVQATPRQTLIYGASQRGKIDSDAAMQAFLLREDAFSAPCDLPVAPARRQVYVRGHIPSMGEHPDVVSLDEHCFSNGAMRALRLDAFLAGDAQALVRLETHYDYIPEEINRVSAHRALRRLTAAGLVGTAVDPQSGLCLFKYSRSVFYDRSWGADPMLLRARGHVYDVAGNLVSNPFDKIFNLGEPGGDGALTGMDLPADMSIVATNKLNGFLGVVSPHPVCCDGEKLLVHSSGTFDSRFVGYILDYLPPPVRGPLTAWLHRHPMTLMFEVIHPEDPHIIAYGPEFHGLHLIGARDIRQDAPLMTEEALDDIADQLGFSRPRHFTTTFGELRARVREDQTEGYMVRAADATQRTLLKIKTPYYLTTKFLARMKDGNWKHLYANPRDFKRKIDEEFYSLVDTLRETVRLEEVLELGEAARRDMVGEMVRAMLSASNDGSGHHEKSGPALARPAG